MTFYHLLFFSYFTDLICTDATVIVPSLNRNMWWKSAGSATKGGYVDISAITFRELLVTIASSNSSFYSINVLSQDVLDTVRTFKTGYYLNSSNYGGAAISVRQSRVELQNVFENGAEIAGGGRIFVYYL